jgi:hypothetical protein
VTPLRVHDYKGFAVLEAVVPEHEDELAPRSGIHEKNSFSLEGTSLKGFVPLRLSVTHNPKPTRVGGTTVGAGFTYLTFLFHPDLDLRLPEPNFKAFDKSSEVYSVYQGSVGSGTIVPSTSTDANVFLHDCPIHAEGETEGAGTSGSPIYVNGRLSATHWGSIENPSKRRLNVAVRLTSQFNKPKPGSPFWGSSLPKSTLVPQAAPVVNEPSVYWQIREECGDSLAPHLIHAAAHTRISPVTDLFSAHSTHLYCKGSAELAGLELSNVQRGSFACESTDRFQLCLEQVEKEIRELVTNSEELVNGKFATYQPDVLSEIKSDDSGPGFPFKNKFSTFKDLIDHASTLCEDPITEFQNYLQQAQEVVCSGQALDADYFVFSKRDAYNEGKLRITPTNPNPRFRTIQASEVTLNFICAMYLKNVTTFLKLKTPWMFVVTNEEQWEEKVYRRLKDKAHTMGIDYSRFDKTQSPTITSWIVKTLLQYTHAPTAIVDWIAQHISKPKLRMPDGSVLQMDGTNPSGNYLTTVINSYSHRLYNLYLFSEILDIHPQQVDDRCVSVMLSDDGIDGFYDVNDARKVAQEVHSCARVAFNLKTKLQLLDGEPFPPGYLPIFLADAFVERCGYTFRVPGDFRKRLAKFQVDVANNDPKLYVEMLSGVCASAIGFLQVRHADPHYPWPDSFNDFYSLYTSTLSAWNLSNPAAKVPIFTVETARYVKVYLG